MTTRPPPAWHRILDALALLLAAAAPGLASASACTAKCLAPGDYSLSMT